MLVQVLKHNSWLMLQQAAASLVPLALVPHVVRTIGVQQFGTVVVAVAWAGYAVIFVQYSFASYGPKYIAQLDGNKVGQLVMYTQIQRAKSLLCGAALVFLVCGYLLSGNRHWGILFLLIAMPVAASLNSIWYLQSKGKFSIGAIVSAFGTFSAVAIGFILIREDRHYSLDLTALVFAIPPLFVGVGTFLAVRSTGNIELPMIATPRSSISNLLKEGFPVFVSQAISAIYLLGGAILIGLINGNEAAGAYGVIERLANAFNGFCLLAYVAAYPKLARLFAKDLRAFWRLMIFTALIYFGTLGLIVAVAFINHELFINYLFGKDFAFSNHAALVYWGFLWAGVGLFGPMLSGYLVIIEEGSRVIQVNFLVLLITICFGLPALKLWGAAGWLGVLVIAQGIPFSFLLYYYYESINVKGI